MGSLQSNRGASPLSLRLRACFCVALVYVPGVWPVQRFALTVAFSERVALMSFGLLAVLLAVTWRWAPVGRWSERSSRLWLVSASLLGALGFAVRAPLQAAVAGPAGMFDGPVPWHGIEPADGAEFTHPFAGYSLRTPPDWSLREGPVGGTHELVLESGGETLAVLRPSCEVTDTPLAVRAFEVQQLDTGTKRQCGTWQEGRACLLTEPHGDHGEAWYFLAPGPTRFSALRFILEDANARQPALAVIQSLRLEPEGFEGPPCPIPTAWAFP